MENELKELSLNELSNFFDSIRKDKFDEKFQKFIEKFKTLEKVSSKVELEQLIFDCICKKLENGEEKEEISIDLKNLNKKNLRKFSETLQKTKLLDRIQLQIDSKAMKHVSEGIKNNKSIKKMVIKSIDNISCHLLSESLVSNDHLETIELNSLRIKKKVIKFLFNFLNFNKTIKELSFPYCYFGDKITSSLFKTLKNNNVIEKINLSENNLSELGSKKFSEYIKFNQNLKYINLNSNILQDSDLMSISDSLKGHQSIEILKISHNEIGEEGIEYLFNCLQSNSTLRKLDISYNDIGMEGIKIISENLKKNRLFSLKKLALNGNYLQGIKMKIFSESLLTNKHLKHLVYSEERIEQFEMDLLCQSLAINNSLKSLKIFDCSISIESMKILSDSLLNINLKSLVFKSVDCDPNNFRFFCDSLKLNHSLNSIAFKNVSLNFDFFFSLIETLKVNCSLTEIALPKYYNFPLYNLLEYLIDCNKEWKPNNQFFVSPYFFKKCVFVFICCMKMIEKKLPFKFGKFLFFEIIKRVDRKSFLSFDFPVNNQDYEGELKNIFAKITKKRKRDIEDEKSISDFEEDIGEDIGVPLDFFNYF